MSRAHRASAIVLFFILALAIYPWIFAPLAKLLFLANDYGVSVDGAFQLLNLFYAPLELLPEPLDSFLDRWRDAWLGVEYEVVLD